MKQSGPASLDQPASLKPPSYRKQRSPASLDQPASLKPPFIGGSSFGRVGACLSEGRSRLSAPPRAWGRRGEKSGLWTRFDQSVRERRQKRGVMVSLISRDLGKRGAPGSRTPHFASITPIFRQRTFRIPLNASITPFFYQRTFRIPLCAHE